MNKPENTARLMPDVASHAQPHLVGELDWVGMEQIELPIQFDAGDGEPQRCSARIGAFVNLKRKDKRGIHMSRLYLLVAKAFSEHVLSADLLRQVLCGFLDSHAELSDYARLCISFEQLIRRRALRSEHMGWRAYPIRLAASLGPSGFNLEVGTEVMYSSTCPASAALSRQLVQEQFAQDFDSTQDAVSYQAVLSWLGSERGMVATPHAQRSVAAIKVRYVDVAEMDLLGLIDRVESALGTAVQTAVKREDEQAFALANGGHLMFCEDAARYIQRALDEDQRIADFAVRVEHQESLHPHDAVAYASKGIVDGYGAAV